MNIQMNDRIQKFLLIHYRHLYEETIIESAFAEVDYRGNGIRQYYLGLTQNNFIMCTETLPPAYGSLMRCTAKSKKVVHPEIECLELDRIVPFKMCEFNVCKRFQRNFISVSINNRKKRYFEFGEHLMRCFYYDVWTEYIFRLNKNTEILYSETSSEGDSGEELEEMEEKESQNNVQLLHKNLNFERYNESSELCGSSEKSSENYQEKEKVNNLKRRIHNLNHNIKAQFEKVIGEENPTPGEKTHLLVTNEKTRKKAGMTTTKSEHKPVVEIYKKSPKSSMNSFSNIWF